jgi:hypothetical protein
MVVGAALRAEDGDDEGYIGGDIEQLVLPITLEESGQAIQGVELLDWRPLGCWYVPAPQATPSQPKLFNSHSPAGTFPVSLDC